MDNPSKKLETGGSPILGNLQIIYKLGDIMI